MKAYLEFNQESSQSSLEHEQYLKAKVLDMYYGKLHMNCYHFYQQCKDHFETIQTIGANWTPFVVFFFVRSKVNARCSSSVIEVKK